MFSFSILESGSFPILTINLNLFVWLFYPFRALPHCTRNRRLLEFLSYTWPDCTMALLARVPYVADKVGKRKLCENFLLWIVWAMSGLLFHNIYFKEQFVASTRQELRVIRTLSLSHKFHHFSSSLGVYSAHPSKNLVQWRCMCCAFLHLYSNVDTVCT